MKAATVCSLERAYRSTIRALLCRGPGNPARRWLLWGTVCTGTLSVVVSLALLTGTTRPAMAGDETPPNSRAPGAPAPDESATGAADFGASTPSDKFVQTFQQQVTRQLQEALAQSGQAQESRLETFERQQKELSDQIQSIQQTLGEGSARTAGPEDRNPDPPQVNVRHPIAPDSSAQGAVRGSADNGPSAMGSLLASVLPGTAGSATLAAVERASTRDPSADRGGAMPGGALAADSNIAPHGFVEGHLLNGVVATVGGPDRESIVALRGTYQAANGYLVDLDGCFALVQGKPEIGTGRIDFKLSRLTCNFPDGASRTWDTAGWLVDADGIRGLRATIVENAGRKALVAAAGGALGGVGQRLSQEQYQISSVSGISGTGAAATGVASTFIGSSAQDAAGGAATGAANALTQSITEYYNLYTPSLQVGGGTPVTVVLANDLRLPPSGRELSQTHTAKP